MLRVGAPTNLRLSGRLSQFFDARTRQRGIDYFFGGAVHVESASEDFLLATVTGTAEYEVALEIEGKVLVADCSCPYAADHGELCKHIWSTLLAADRQDFAADLPLPSRIELRPLEDDELYEEEPFVKLAPPPRRTQSIWKQQLGALGVSPAKVVPAEQRNVEQWVITYSISQSPGDTLTLSVTYVRPRPKGGWTKPQPMRVDRSEFHRIPLAGDRRVLGLLAPRTQWGWAAAERLD